MLTQLLLIAVGWGILPILFRLSHDSFPPSIIAAAYFAIACGFVSAYALYQRAPFRVENVPRSVILYILLAGAIGALALYNFVDAVGATASTTTCTVVVSYVLPVVITAIIAHQLFHERITPIGYASAALVFGSVVVFALHGVRK